MPRGGARSGAGRKTGQLNKSTAELKAAVAASGETPLDYMLRVLRDRTVDHDRRDRMAMAAAPFCHSKLAAIEHSGEIGLKSAHDVSDDELANIASRGGKGTAEAPVDPAKLN